MRAIWGSGLTDRVDAPSTPRTSTYRGTLASLTKCSELVFLLFHFAESNADHVTHKVPLYSISEEPNYKQCAGNVEKVRTERKNQTRMR